MDTLGRREFLQRISALGLLAGFERIAPGYAWALESPRTHRGGEPVDLRIHDETIDIDGELGSAMAVNGSVPGPLVRMRQGDDIVLRVSNGLDQDTSIHWHGLLVPTGMDGVPGVSFPGIPPGETFEYRYPVRQSGTYWYHSHSGLQEQSGVYGPLIIDPAEPDPFAYDREYVVMLSDWTFEDPHRVLAKLKKSSGYYNFQQLTVPDFFRDGVDQGWGAALSSRITWGMMRMNRTDISDVTGYTYTYLMNGLGPVSNWTGLFRPGERIRLRVINGAAMTYFDVRIPGLPMTVVQADGQNVEPVTVDEFRIGVAETYDVLVSPGEESAYTIFAEAMDRSGYSRGTLAVRPGLSAPIPARRPRPLRTMADMGMPMEMGRNEMSESPGDGGASAMAGMEMNQPEPTMAGTPHAPHADGGLPPDGRIMQMHGPDHHGAGNSMVAMMPRDRLGEPGDGLENVGHRVLVYADLRSLDPWPDRRAPQREIELHLTGNMERYMWSFDGKKFSEVNGPIPFRLGERLRMTLVNDTMMDHPIHLHGMWMELDNGAGIHKPRKHTISVKPGERLSVEIDVDAPPGHWAFHCHLLYHMDMGMFRVVSVEGPTEESAS